MPMVAYRAADVVVPEPIAVWPADALALVSCCVCGASCCDDIDKAVDAQFCGWDHCVTEKLAAALKF